MWWCHCWHRQQMFNIEAVENPTNPNWIFDSMRKKYDLHGNKIGIDILIQWMHGISKTWGTSMILS